MKVADGAFGHVFAVAQSDRCPLAEFLDDCQKHDRVRMLRILQWTGDFGPLKNNAISKPLTDKLFEFRTGQLRVVWFYGKDRGVIICCQGFLKQAQKTPPSEIEHAQKWYDNYCAAHLANAIEVIDHDFTV